MRIKDKWTDYFKKPKEKMTVRNQYDVAAFLEESFTHTSRQLKYKGVWTDYFKKQKPQLRNPITSQHDVAAFLEYSVTHTADEKRYKGVWTDYFKQWRKDEEDPKRNAFNLEAFLEVPYIVNPTKKGILELVDTYTLPSTGRGVSFTSDNAYIAVSHAPGTAPNDTQVTLLKLASDELSYADSYKEGANVWTVAFHPGGEYLVCMRDGLTHMLILQRSGDGLSFVRRVSTPYATDGIHAGFIDEDYFVTTLFTKYANLYYWNNADPDLKDTALLSSYPSQFGINENYIVFGIAGWGTDARVQILKQEGDSLSLVASGMQDSKYTNSHGANFNNDRSVVVAANDKNDYELVVLSFDGSTLTVENEYGSVVENYPSQVRISPDGKWVAVNHYDSPYLSLFSLSGYELARTSTYTLPGRAIDIKFSPDGEYLGVAHYNSPYFTLLRIV